MAEYKSAVERQQYGKDRERSDRFIPQQIRILSVLYDAADVQIASEHLDLSAATDLVVTLKDGTKIHASARIRSFQYYTGGGRADITVRATGRVSELDKVIQGFG